MYLLYTYFLFSLNIVKLTIEENKIFKGKSFSFKVNSSFAKRENLTFFKVKFYPFFLYYIFLYIFKCGLSNRTSKFQK